MTPDLKQLQELLAKLAVTQHAHTYASENADIYHAYDSGWQDCVKLMRPAIDALLTHRAALLASHEALSAEVADMRARKDVAYDERNRMVAVLTKLFPASLERHPEEDLEWEDDWRWVVYIDSPAGQLSWHIHDRQVPMFEHLPRFQGRKWDGHTTEDKYKRLSEMPVQAAEVAGLRTAAKDLLTHTILYRQTHRVCEMPDHGDCSDKSNLERSINALRAAIDAAREGK